MLKFRVPVYLLNYIILKDGRDALKFKIKDEVYLASGIVLKMSHSWCSKLSRKNQTGKNECRSLLGGGFHRFFGIFIPIPGEDSDFDEHIFQMGWFNHHLVFNEASVSPLVRSWCYR